MTNPTVRRLTPHATSRETNFLFCRPKVDILAEYGDPIEYVHIKKMNIGYISYVFNAWAGLEEADKLHVVSTCHANDYKLPMSLTYYPDLQEDSVARVKENIQTLVDTNIATLADEKANEMDTTLRHQVRRGLRDSAIRAPPGMADCMIGRPADQSKEDWAKAVVANTHTTVTAKLNYDIAKWLKATMNNISLKDSLVTEHTILEPATPAPKASEGRGNKGWDKLKRSLAMAEKARDAAEEKIGQLRVSCAIALIVVVVVIEGVVVVVVVVVVAAVVVVVVVVVVLLIRALPGDHHEPQARSWSCCSRAGGREREASEEVQGGHGRQDHRDQPPRGTHQGQGPHHRAPGAVQASRAEGSGGEAAGCT